MLYLVATPIGNLGDISQRALDTLREVDFLICEEPRKTGILLQHFDIHKPQTPFHEHNEQKALPGIIRRLINGESAALVTSAGTPAVSDPGFRLVRAALEAEIPLTVIPGPTALIMALVLSGLAVHSFTFRGFPPHKGGPRKRFLLQDLNSPYTLIYYESPYRLVDFLSDALLIFGDRRAALANDLTKMFEKVSRSTLSELLEEAKSAKLLGEYTVVIAGKEE